MIKKIGENMDKVSFIVETLANINQSILGFAYRNRNKLSDNDSYFSSSRGRNFLSVRTKLYGALWK